uniref:acyl-coenzyme A thioesterase 2, mitochondrial-like n=1 Tax=Oncorhynchus gorbuscha TaxID=8017 RepID=UPI001EAE90F5|nr:acyl-coenzyme A thioesterase 2, mitochondrial-like [Oncorhynchus gorbuscha]
MVKGKKRLRKKDIHTPLLVQISVYSGHISQDFSEQAAVACTVVERCCMAPIVQKIDIYKDGIQGTLFIPAGPGPFPAELELSGGGGGLFEHRSSLLASESYVSLVLQYPTDVSTTVAIGCKYFEVFAQFIVEKDSRGLKCTVQYVGEGREPVSYPGAGHLIKPFYTPHFRSSNSQEQRQRCAPTHP